MEALSPDDVRRIDALYQPFPPFSEWVSLDGDSEALRDEVARLESLRAGARPEDFKQAVDVAMRAAAVDTGALEGLYETDRGFTMSVALQSAAAEIGFAQRGPEVPKLIAAHVRAYEYVLDAVTKSHPITETWIRELHAILVEPQATYSVLTTQGEQFQPLPKGEYKTQPNHVRLADGSFFPYAPVDEVRPEMARLVAEVTSPAFEAAHPVGQAAYAHYAFVRIHPFADGNGRVARALASVFTYRTYGVPLVVFADERESYLDALQAADTGAPDAFARFTRGAVLTALRMVAVNLKDRTARSLSEVVAAARGDAGDLGVPSAELDAIGNGVAEYLAAALDRLAAESHVRTVARARVDEARRGGWGLDAPVGFRWPNEIVAVRLVVHALTDADGFLSVAVTAAGDPERAVVVFDEEGDAEYFSVGELFPVKRTSATSRLDHLADRAFARVLARASTQP